MDIKIAVFGGPFHQNVAPEAEAKSAIYDCLVL